MDTLGINLLSAYPNGVRLYIPGYQTPVEIRTQDELNTFLEQNPNYSNSEFIPHKYEAPIDGGELNPIVVTGTRPSISERLKNLPPLQETTNPNNLILPKIMTPEDKEKERLEKERQRSIESTTPEEMAKLLRYADKGQFGIGLDRIYADRIVSQTSLGPISLIASPFKGLDIISPSRWIGAMRQDSDMPFMTSIYSEDNPGVASRHMEPGMQQLVNTIFDIGTISGITKGIQSGIQWGTSWQPWSPPNPGMNSQLYMKGFDKLRRPFNKNNIYIRKAITTPPNEIEQANKELGKLVSPLRYIRKDSNGRYIYEQKFVVPTKRTSDLNRFAQRAKRLNFFKVKLPGDTEYVFYNPNGTVIGDLTGSVGMDGSIPRMFDYAYMPLEEYVSSLKKGGKIKTKDSQKGSFTKYCNGKVTDECIQRGKNSPNPKIRKKAIFAQNARKWHK